MDIEAYRVKANALLESTNYLFYFTLFEFEKNAGKKKNNLKAWIYYIHTEIYNHIVTEKVCRKFSYANEF